MTAVDKTYNVLFLCTGNTARSIMAESLLREIGKGRFNSYSAGSQPKGQIHPKALELLKTQRMPTDGLSSKAWDVFAKPDAPQMDFVVTVCDNAAGEVCPVWPGQPMTAHWSIPDPAAVEGDDEAQRRAFADACHMLVTRIRLFTSLPLAKLDRLAIKRNLDDRPPAIVNDLGRALLAEFLGTALLLAVIVGSGTMGERMAAGNDGIALLANSLATGCALFVLILVLAPISGAHFNPLVSLIARLEGEVSTTELLAFAATQLIAAFAGVALAHGMFDLALWAPSARQRTGFGQWLAEGVATFGLVLAILGSRRYGVVVLAAAVAAYICAAYWFTASTSFANPVVTLARGFTPTFAGIAPSHVAAFVAAQCLGAMAAFAIAELLGLKKGRN